MNWGSGSNSGKPEIDEGALMQQVKSEIASNYYQELFGAVRDKCIDKLAAPVTAKLGVETGGHGLSEHQREEVWL
ncbi:hypothetical protein CYMTET_27313 [Cymbomonas tetramitiformis]|uniref:Uncharacterized protein n=1 Tax=Cymbomonas tetramitiformis TaxID=36881 RepID=A0AAE0KXB9_9CHLO|nr:hypothetical protein CYMTET_27313 [Cymbomonas tetramitiformis]